MNRPRKAALLVGAVTVALCLAAFYIASNAPDGLEKTAADLGFEHRARSAEASPLAGYQVRGLSSPAASTITAALGGALVCFGAVFGLGKALARRKSRFAPGSARPVD